MKLQYPLVGLCGFGRVGKDTAAAPLIARGYTRKAFGDIIKARVDRACMERYGYSAFTTNDAEKRMIRPLLESHGDAHYDEIMAEYFASLDGPTVNNRVACLPEAKLWVERGGILVLIVKPGCNGETDWERERVSAIANELTFHRTIFNSGTVEQLQLNMLRAVGLEPEFQLYRSEPGTADQPEGTPYPRSLTASFPQT